MRRRLLLGSTLALSAALLFGACGKPSLDLGLAMEVPQGLLEQATSVQLSVFDASLAKCNATNGEVGTIPSSAQVFPLGTTGCPTGDAYCATITLDKDGSTKIFAVTATRAGAPLAQGCATAVLNQDPLAVSVKVWRYTPPPCCNDGKIEPGEQCDNGMAGTCTSSQTVGACSGIVEDAVCNCDCTAKEILLSHDDATAPGFKNAPAGSKFDLALSFGPGGTGNPEVLRALFENAGSANTTGYDLRASFLGADLYPIASPKTLDLQLGFPTPCSAVLAGNTLPLDQRYPALATAATDTVVAVYQSNQDNVGNNFDVFLSPQTRDGCVDTAKTCKTSADCQTSCDPASLTCLPAVRINTMAGGATDPHVAGGPPGVVLVTWTRSDGVYGRLWKTDGSVLPATGELQIAPGGSAARVAGNASGFGVVYQGAGPGDQDGVFLRSVDPFGEVTSPVLVNANAGGVQDQADIAMQTDGGTVVVFRSAGNIYFQRFTFSSADLSFTPTTVQDQSAALNTNDAASNVAHANPVVAGANGFFIAAWETPSATAGKTDIAAQFIGETTGFGYNSVSGQNVPFLATDQTLIGVADRHRPAVAMSGYVAIGWEDDSTTNAGIWVRRFPAPTM
jgi:hypothetical protein